MSLSLTRRITRAALLVAAGAAPVVGAAGAAGAAELPHAPELGGLTTVDGAGLGSTVDGASRQGAAAASETGGRIVGTALPAAHRTVRTAGAQAAPVVREAAGGVAGPAAGGVLGGAAGTAARGALPVQGLPVG
ncbi:ATP-binding protein [Streptomyces sp. NPDC052052]|uniref:ATP-binding protein n=1 Tax=Streptomyces sp. NPDC052052 TaxID=3154756 RepID=UPI0034259764